jgi:glycosyltransferase involved in cell wall biosynthesis
MDGQYLMQVSFIVPCRNKAKFVARTVETVLAQTYSPMEIVLSDQGSTDGTLEILQKMAAEYKGPNTVRVLQCPHTEFRGMAGLNQHLNWLHGQITGDIVIMCSADDLNHPERAEWTVKAFKEHNPSYVGTCVQYLDSEYRYHGEMTAFGIVDGDLARPDCFVDPVENIINLIGSSASSAWSRDLFEKYGPLRMVESQDILLPFFATCERGIFYVNKPLHAYVRHACANNTGMEGVVRAASKEAGALLERIKTAEGEEKEVLQLQYELAKCTEHASVETNNYHYTSNFFAILRRVNEMQINLIPELYEALLQKAVEGANIWTCARDNLTMLRVRPEGMKV